MALSTCGEGCRAPVVCDIRGMIPLSMNRYKNCRFPAEIINYGVWPYYRFCPSYRDVEELLFARRIIMT
jgi:transposase-like protein